MSNPKQLGAKEMLHQSVVYLYNSYREEGYNAEQSKEKVADELEIVYQKYQQKDLLATRKTKQIANPKRIVDNILSDVDQLPVDRLQKRSIQTGLLRLKSLL